MMNSSQFTEIVNIQECINRASKWSIEEASFIAYYPSIINGVPIHRTTSFTRDEISQVHPDLPIALEQLVQLSSKNQISLSADGAHVRNTLAFWGAKSSAFEDTSGTLHYCSVLRSMSLVEPSDDVFFTADEFTVHTCVKSGCQLMFASNIARRHFKMSSASVEAMVSNWKSRYQTALALGYSGHELVQAVFNRIPNTPDVSFQDVDFS